METFAWKEDNTKLFANVDEIIRLREKERHARYYREHRKEIIRRQKKANEIRDRKSKEYYEKNKERILVANNQRYWNNVDERRRKAREYYQSHKEDILRRRKDVNQRRKNPSIDREYQELELGYLS